MNNLKIDKDNNNDTLCYLNNLEAIIKKFLDN